jgi:exodeoxyribonuclease-5
MVGYDKLTLQELGHYDFLLVDEASMLDQKLMKDLTSYNIPILFVGDSEQLPSFGDDFNIMDHHDIHLTEIHRVAEGNPIISLSRDIRENGKITKNMLYKHVDGSHLKFIDKKNFNTSYITSNHHDIVVTGTNRKRIMVNNMYRSLLSDWDIAPRMGEPIMCLRNTWFPEMLDYMYNGEIYIPTEITQKDGEITKYLLESNDSNKTFEVKIEECAWDGSCEKKAFEQDGNTFTYSYAATCHKMQGSQFNNICYYREDVSGFCDQRKFDYTAITRAKENLTVVL